MKKIILVILGIVVLLAVGFFVASRFSPPPTAEPPPSEQSTTASSEATPDKSQPVQPQLAATFVTTPPSGNNSQAPTATTDARYLIFWGLPDLTTLAPAPTLETYESNIKKFATRLGTTGDGKNQQLGFGWGMPIFVSDETAISTMIRRGFEVAKRTGVAVHFNVDDHVQWDGRPDLWNWFDPDKSGYNPKNTANVEWYDWDGTANKRQYLSPSGFTQQTPYMCLNSPAVKREITRIVAKIVGPVLKDELDKLHQTNQDYLFAGITVGAELGFPDFTGVASDNPILNLMEKDGAPHKPIGYCSLTNAGYSKSNPPRDFNLALAQVNQEFIAFWDKQFVDAGVSSSRLYTHVPAGAPQDSTNNAPIWIAFNPYARPGWSTYPQGPLSSGFQPLYDELAKRRNPLWGGVEANAVSGDPNKPNAVDWNQYLDWHFSHGAKLVGVNFGGAGALQGQLTNGAFSDAAIAAYKKFLKGEKLSE